MDKIIQHLIEVLPSGDYFFNLLIFLLLVFGSLYIIFKLLFHLGDAATARAEERAKKAEKAKKEKAERVAKAKEEKEKKAEARKEREKTIVINIDDEDTLEFLEEEKVVVRSDAQHSNEHNDSYVMGRSVGQSYTYGENFLHDYYNNGKTVYTNEEVVVRDIPKPTTSEIGLKEKSDEIIEAYNDMPAQLKRYIIDKILSKSMNMK